VLLPVRDGEAHLAACLDSVLSQSFGDFEVVAMDHASHDSSPAILADFAARDPRLRVLKSSAPGLPGALNESVAASRGAFLARMDADDLCLPGRFGAQMALLEKDPGLGLVGTEVEFFGDGELSEGIQDYQGWINALRDPESIARERFIECPLPHPSWMGRRGLFESLGYLDDGNPEDYHLVLRALSAGWRMAKPEGVLLRWRDHGARHSRSHPRYGRQAFMRLRARWIARDLAAGGTCAVWGAGDRGRLLVRMLQGEGVKVEFVVGIGQKGLNPPSSAHGVPVLAPEEAPFRSGLPLIACVGAPGARAEIRAFAAGRSWAEGKDYWFAS
jgi:glycosyltransferase involved in cell wall biosynthesis